jgi:uncharacterized protein YaaR (DUF327 family)
MKKTKLDKLEYYKNRCLAFADCILKKGYTIRQTASELSYSKTLIWHDIHNRLPQFDSELYVQVCQKLKINQHLGQLRGGISTSLKWKGVKNNEKK